MEDTIVQSIIEKFQSRSILGIKKYGTTLDRTDLKTIDWIQHTQEELMDAILYLERLKKNISETQSPPRLCFVPYKSPPPKPEVSVKPKLVSPLDDLINVFIK